MKIVIIIPARYGSNRYKGKPLVKILNREMILRVADICAKVTGKKNLYIECPAFASNVVDKIGAGDAMLSIVSIAFRAGIDKRLSLLLSSLAAAQSVESIGNSISVDKDKMLKVIQNLIK